ncbi:hypothetical protein ACCO45_006628 [Purpureocillium lilacinum]|uniref:Uncharacterized protein n=1 Tax=Purpureocillium lilacinum TaxID=33203 RepID=A0ACC4DSN6_PURLI
MSITRRRPPPPPPHPPPHRAGEGPSQDAVRLAHLPGRARLEERRRRDFPSKDLAPFLTALASPLMTAPAAIFHSSRLVTAWLSTPKVSDSHARSRGSILPGPATGATYLRKRARGWQGAQARHPPALEPPTAGAARPDAAGGSHMLCTGSDTAVHLPLSETRNCFTQKRNDSVVQFAARPSIIRSKVIPLPPQLPRPLPPRAS